MKIAVTGASGFIGRYVLNELCTRDLEIVAATRDVANLRGINSSIKVIQMDIGNPGAGALQQLGSPDTLIHLAWDGLPNYKSLHHFDVELPRQYNFLKGLVESGLSSMLVTGTCFEYGMQSGMLSESMPAQPANPYGFAKDALRQQLQYLQTVLPFSLTWARLFYMYGEGQAGASLYPKFMEAVFRRDKVFNMSGGEQLRDYLDVAEVAQQIVRLAILRKNAGVINLCSGVPVSVRSLVERWIQQSDSDIALNLGHYPYPDYEPMAFWGARNRFDSLFD